MLTQPALYMLPESMGYSSALRASALAPVAPGMDDG